MVAQQFDSEVAVCPRGLPGNSQRLNEERREIEPRPNAKARNGDEWHKVLLPPRMPDCGLTTNQRPRWLQVLPSVAVVFTKRSLQEVPALPARLRQLCQI